MQSSTDLQISPTLMEEGSRVMQVCNACRYCEGFCAVFPAMEKRRSFTAGDLNYLANLCHNCQACYHACQYIPPHEFAINVPKVLGDIRARSYAQYAWPRFLAHCFYRNGLVVSVVVAAGLSVVVGLMLLLIAPERFFGVHLGEGAFYQIMPFTIMAGIPMLITGLAALSFTVGIMRYWKHTNARWGGWPAVRHAMHAVATLRYLGKHNNQQGNGCNTEDDHFSQARRVYHQLTFYGFLLCLASTTLASVYHHFLEREAPYGYLEPPVLLGTVGGIMLCIGTAGLFWMKRRMLKITRSQQSAGMDDAFTITLFWVSLTGLVLLALRETNWMGLTLAIHLGFVYSFFIVLPFSKFVHAFYRSAALLASAEESLRS